MDLSQDRESHYTGVSKAIPPFPCPEYSVACFLLSGGCIWADYVTGGGSGGLRGEQNQFGPETGDTRPIDVLRWDQRFESGWT
jgi:hypothetical protein